MSRAEQFLEGFKLGKLGAGKTKLAPIEDKEPIVTKMPEKVKFRIISTEPITAQFPHIKWQDPDGYIYMMEVERNKENKWYIQIFCGKPESVGSNKVKRSDEDWFIRSFLLTEKQIKTLYNNYLPYVRSGGIDGMFKGSLLDRFEPLSQYKEAYIAWKLHKALSV
jgi:hypothetical protein